jgi:endogenous inhibitor of DNA gyrase (YacG/DUF329 family)
VEVSPALAGSDPAIHIGAMNEIDRKTSARTCPVCGKPTDQAFRPFCSKRCADVDLNRWLSGVYVVPVKDEEDEDGERPPEGGEGDQR